MPVKFLSSASKAPIVVDIDRDSAKDSKHADGPQSYEHTWTIDKFKDWHQNKRGFLDSPVMFTPAGSKRRVLFRMRLISDGIDPATGRVNLKLYVMYYTRKLFAVTPIEIKLAVIDEKGVKRHIHVFELTASGIPRWVHIARYFYRTYKDDLKNIKDKPYYLIFDNTASFHFEMTFPTNDQETPKSGQKKQLGVIKPKESGKSTSDEPTSASTNRRPILGKIWSALRKMVKA